VRWCVAFVPLIACWSLACGPSERETATPDHEGDDTQAEEHAAGAASGESAGASEDPLPEEPPPLDDSPSPARSSGSHSFDIGSWANQRGIEAKLDAVERCEPAQVGDKPEDTLWCWRAAPARKGYESRIIALYVVRGKMLSKAFELPLAVSLEGEREKPLVELAPQAEEEGKSVVFSETGTSCDDALSRAQADHPDDPAAAKAKQAAITDICRHRGRYRWMAGTLRRVGPP
jgi:hypothetical protein